MNISSLLTLLLLSVSLRVSLSTDSICIALPPSDLCDDPPVEHYYYTTSLHECLVFNYTGCPYGIPNIFTTYDECRNVCIIGIPDPVTPPPYTDPPIVPTESTQPPTGDLCQLNHDNGNWVFLMTSSRYFHNATVHVCQWFHYLGEGGNENNFLTKEECEARCIDTTPTTTTTTPPTTTTTPITPTTTTTTTIELFSSDISTVINIPIITTSPIQTTTSYITSIITSSITSITSISSTSLSTSTSSQPSLSTSTNSRPSSSTSNIDQSLSVNMQGIIVYSTLLVIVLLIAIAAVIFTLVVCVVLQRNKAIGPGPIQDTLRTNKPSSRWFWRSSGSTSSESSHTSPSQTFSSPISPSQICPSAPLHPLTSPAYIIPISSNSEVV